jgi:hypothetical protein
VVAPVVTPVASLVASPVPVPVPAEVEVVEVVAEVAVVDASPPVLVEPALALLPSPSPLQAAVTSASAAQSPRPPGRRIIDEA